jgi:hypothetical protein
MRRLDPKNESPQQLFSLPVRKHQVYTFLFLPAFFWLSVVTLSMALLLLLAGSNMPQTFGFLATSLFSAGVLLNLAVNCAIANFPHPKMADKHFVGWLLGLTTLSAMFYLYRIPIVIGVFVLSFLPLRKSHFYATSNRIIGVNIDNG